MKPMSLILLCITLYTPVLFCQAVSLSGTVVVQNSQYEKGNLQFLHKARISAKYTAPVRSNLRGQFELVFTEEKEGANVRLQVDYPNYVIVNEADLSHVLLGKNESVQVVMADWQYLRQRQMTIQGHLREILVEAFRSKAGVSGGIDVDQYLKMEKKVDQIKRRLGDYAYDLAATNLDHSSDTYRRAFSHLLLGEIDQAASVLDVYDAEKVLESGILSKPGSELDKKELQQLLEALELQMVISTLSLEFQEAIKYHELIAQLNHNANHDLYRQAKYYSELGWKQFLNEMEESKGSFRKLMGIIETLPNNEHPHLIRAYENIGDFHFFNGRFKEALKDYQKAIDLMEGLKGKKFLALPDLYNKISNTFMFLGNYEKAFCFLNQALEIQEENPAANRLDLAETYVTLGRAFTSLGNGRKSLSYFEKAINIHEIVNQPSHPDLIQMYYLAAGSYELMDQSKQALTYYQKALKIAESVYRADQPQLGIAYLNIGKIYHTLGLPEESLDYYKQALPIIEDALEKDNPGLIVAYKNIASIYEELSDYDQSLYYHTLVLKIEKETLGPYHPNLVFTYYSIAKVYFLMGDKTKGNAFIKRAVELSERPVTKFTAVEEEESAATEEITLVPVPKSQSTEVATPDPLPAKEEIAAAPAVEEESMPADPAPIIRPADKKEVIQVAQVADDGLPRDQIRDLFLEQQFLRAERLIIDFLGQHPQENEMRAMLILAYLYQGKYQKAKDIWYLFKTRTLKSGSSFSGILSSELQFLEDNGIAHQQADKFKRMIGDD